MTTELLQEQIDDLQTLVDRQYEELAKLESELEISENLRDAEKVSFEFKIELKDEEIESLSDQLANAIEERDAASAEVDLDTKIIAELEDREFELLTIIKNHSIQICDDLVDL